MPGETASLRAVVQGSIVAAHQGARKISDAIAAAVAANLGNSVRDSDRLKAVVLDAVRGSIEGMRIAGGDIGAAAEAAVIGITRTLEQAGVNSMQAAGLTAASVIQVAVEIGSDVGQAAKGAIHGAAAAAGRIGREGVDTAAAAATAAVDAADELGAETAKKVRQALGGPTQGSESVTRKAATAHGPEPVRLGEETLTAFTAYIHRAETEMLPSLQARGPFLWAEASAKRAETIRKGRTIAQYWGDDRPIDVPNGLIHDWIGATRIQAATIADTLALVQDYDRHSVIYTPDVIDSRLVSRSGDVFEIYLRLLKKKIITVVLDTDHHVEYTRVSATRWWCRSYTTRIAEVEDAGKPTERCRQPDTGYGFLWRLASYWRFEEQEKGVWVECRAISLTRDVPKGLRWAIAPILKKMPRDSLVATLEATRRWAARNDPAAALRHE